MLDKMKEIIKKNDLCVLATASEGRPHCSLMSYVPDEEVKEIYMVSHRETRKYINLTRNPSVSLLIDNREDYMVGEEEKIKALTVEGEYRPLNDSVKKDSVRLRLLKKNPNLTHFLNDPAAEIFSIRLKSFQLLDGVQDVFIETME
jgi:nitroimidazol reductase NimA-like FMN-containing flavoprotein (pyridoxamine 5'-phosphate oxidase superfamily)